MRYFLDFLMRSFLPLSLKRIGSSWLLSIAFSKCATLNLLKASFIRASSIIFKCQKFIIQHFKRNYYKTLSLLSIYINQYNWTMPEVVGNALIKKMSVSLKYGLFDSNCILLLLQNSFPNSNGSSCIRYDIMLSC